LIILPRFSEEQDPIRTTAFEHDTTTLVACKLVPEAHDGNTEFVVRPMLHGTQDDGRICWIEPLEKQAVLLPIGDTRDKPPQIFKDPKQNQLSKARFKYAQQV
jgi:hypothetical protein